MNRILLKKRYCDTVIIYIAISTLIFNLFIATSYSQKKIKNKNTRNKSIYISNKDISLIKKKLDPFEEELFKTKKWADRYNRKLMTSCLGCPAIDEDFIDEQIKNIGQCKKIPKIKNNLLLLEILKIALTHFFTEEIKKQNIADIADIAWSNTSKYYIECEFKHLKNVVIERKNFWEILQIKITVIPTKKGFLVKPIIDGKYGVGLSSPPQLGKYRDMEPEYNADLNRYCNKIHSQIQDYIHKWKKGDFKKIITIVHTKTRF